VRPLATAGGLMPACDEAVNRSGKARFVYGSGVFAREMNAPADYQPAFRFVEDSDQRGTFWLGMLGAIPSKKTPMLYETSTRL